MEEKHVQIYDTIQHDFVRHYICPYLVTMSIKNDASRKRERGENDEQLHFNPQIDDDLLDRQRTNDSYLFDAAKSFRSHPIEGNFDCPSSSAWFDYYQEFFSTICINEYHREQKGGSQYRQGQEIRRSSRRRKQSNQFEHILHEWLPKDQCDQVVEKWKHSFDGMGWKTETLPLL